MSDKTPATTRDDLYHALQVSEAHYRELVETANSIILRIDSKGVVTFINRFGRAFFGFEESEILGKTPYDTILPEAPSQEARGGLLQQVLNDPDAFASNTNENVKKDGTRVWVNWSNRGVYDDSGNLVEILCIGNDITRLKFVESELSKHHQNLERLVAERTRELSRATAALIQNQNRLMVLSTISSCIIRDESTDYIIKQVLGQLSGIFKNCRAAYTIARPGEEKLRIDYCQGPDTVADLKGRVLTVPHARDFFSRLIHGFTPHVVNDIQVAAEKEALKDIIQKDRVSAYIIVPLHRDSQIEGLLHVYSPLPRVWESSEVELLEQIGESLSVAIRASENKNRLIEQEQFLENVFDGVAIGIFVLGIQQAPPADAAGQATDITPADAPGYTPDYAPGYTLVFENVNQRYRKLKGLGAVEIVGRPVDIMADTMPARDLERFKSKARQCIRERQTVQFLEETRTDTGVKTWLTRLRPIWDDQGRVFRIIGAATDITEQKQAELALQKNQARLTEAQRIAKLGDCERDVSTMVLSCSDQLYRIFGWNERFCPGFQDFMDIVHPDDREHVQETISTAIAEKEPYDMEYRILKSGDEERIVNEIGEVVMDSTGIPVKIAGIVQDVTEQKRFKDEIELARKVFDNAMEGVVVTDRDGTIEFVNRGFTQITGYTPEEVIGQNPSLLKSDRHNREFYKEMWDSLDENGHWSGEIWNRRKSGDAYPEWLSITAITDHRGETVRYMSVFNDLSDLRDREKQIHFQTNYDALTGLPNRTLLGDRLKMSISRSFREKRGLTLIFLDLDDFKHVNDTLGHAKGDKLLQEFASRLTGSVREQDTVARYGGDDFVILLPDTKATDIIIQIIDRIKSALSRSFFLDGKEFFMNASMGVTICPDDGTDPDTLIANADMAMYRAKDQGKGRYGFFTPEINRQVSKRFELENDMRLALKHQEFALYYQPKIDLETGRICGAEALVRWIHRAKGVVPPGDFIPLAEETGLIVPLGEWILDQACIKAREWSEKLGTDFPIAVNISPRQVKDVDLAGQVKQLLEHHGISPANLELEITESALMGNVERAKIMFNTLHDLGIHISIDDFGTGFSSLSYLRLFPINSLKIDKSFIDDIPSDPDSNTMVVTILSMADHLNLVTIAEGVETRAQLDFLKSHQCNQVQGYYFSPPLPETQFLQLLAENVDMGPG